MKIFVRGPIISNTVKRIYDYFGMEATAPKDVSTALENARGEPVKVEINSGGGSVFAGSEIYTALKAYSGKVEVEIVGIAASAASVIAMAGDKVSIAPTAQIMIHNVSIQAAGDYRAMEHEAEVLKNMNKSISNAYVLKTGLDQEELLGLMDSEHWMNAQMAVEKGFADEIMFDGQKQLVAEFAFGQVIPPEIIEKTMNLLLEEDAEAAKNRKLKLYQAQLNLLKMEVMG